MTREPIFARLATSARLKENQSPLFRWFLQHHAEFAAALAGIARPSWKAIAEELRAEGLTTKDGNPIDARYARVVWHRASKACQAKPPSPAPATLPAASMPAAPLPAANLGMLPPGIEPAEKEPRRFTFKFASAKDWTKEPNKGDE
jgi:hypothetical protein